MRISRSAIGLLMLVGACAKPSAPHSDAPTPLSDVPTPRSDALAPSPAEPPAPPIDVDGEAVRLRAALHREVPHLIIDPPTAERGWIARSRAAVANGSERIDRPPLLVVVDRNPRGQQMRIVVARPDADWQGPRRGTGAARHTGRFDHCVT